MLKLIWNSVPGATNYILSSTNLLPWYSTNWVVLTNLTTIPPANGWPITNTVCITPGVTNSRTLYFRVRIDQNNAILYGQ